MRRHALLYGIVLLVACGKSDDAAAPADSAAIAPAAAAPAGLALAEVAGRWNVRVMPETGDSTLLTYEMTATGDMNGWTIKFPDRTDPVPLRVTSVAGDSVVVEAGPYESALRKGVTVSTMSVLRLQGGMLVGRSTARYSVTTADSVRMLRTEGTRIP